MEQVLLSFQRTTGVPADQLKAAIVLVIAYPFALLFGLLRGRPAVWKHLFSLVISGTLYCLLFDVAGYLMLLASACVVYLLAWIGRGSQWGALACFVWAMAHVSVEHYHYQVLGRSFSQFDNSAPLMVLAIKLSSFGWCIYDGTRPEKELSDLQRRLRITRMPGIIEYLGYVFFFGGFLVGPAFEYSDYTRFTNDLPPFDDKMPSRALPTVQCVLTALSCIVVFALGSKGYNLNDAVTLFPTMTWLERCAFIMIASAIARAKFYAAWKLSEGACILAGVGYNGVDPRTGKHLWNRVENIRIASFELPENPKMISDSWNINTSLWLRNYVYVRLATSTGNGWAQLATNMTSAFWHGFHPGYYMFFGTASFFIMVGRSARRHIRPIFLAADGNSPGPYKWLYDIAGVIMTAMSVGYMMVPFVLKEWSSSWWVWGSVGYFMHIIQAIFYVSLEYLGGARFCRRLSGKHSKGATVVMKKVSDKKTKKNE